MIKITCDCGHTAEYDESEIYSHRLICGDSTDRATVERLMDGAKADFDLFGWSGSTLIACEQLGRVCYMCEISTLFCDVIIKRWENFTGQKAVKIS